ncbi:hypothetical protein OIU85_028857, partial [Salix viminalis]
CGKSFSKPTDYIVSYSHYGDNKERNSTARRIFQLVITEVLNLQGVDPRLRVRAELSTRLLTDIVETGEFVKSGRENTIDCPAV